MDIYASDEEKSEAIKQWWRENGMAIFLGIVLGVIGIIGGRYWLNHQTEQAEQAAGLYQQMLMTINNADLSMAESTVAELQSDFSGTPYAAFAASEYATQLALQDDEKAAIPYLEWVVDNAELDAQKDLARLRLAKLHMDQGDYDTALSIINKASTDGFVVLFAELEGDIQILMGNAEAAHEAYQTALNMTGQNDSRRILLQMKQDDVAVE